MPRITLHSNWWSFMAHSWISMLGYHTSPQSYNPQERRFDHPSQGSALPFYNQSNYISCVTRECRNTCDARSCMVDVLNHTRLKHSQGSEVICSLMHAWMCKGNGGVMHEANVGESVDQLCDQWSVAQLARMCARVNDTAHSAAVISDYYTC